MKLNAKRIEKTSPQVKVQSFDTVDSTNTVAKSLAANGCDEGVLVCATRQTAGKGRLGRTFLSKCGGVYFSLVLKPTLSPAETIFITVAAAVAAARAIERISNKKCDIKWVNDIYVDNKKVCGILAEGSNDCIVLGVGINLFAPKGGFSADLPLAGSVFSKSHKILFKNRAKESVISDFINEFFKIYKDIDKKEFIKEYQQKSFLTGKEITYTKGDETKKGIVLGIDDNARLVVKHNGEQEVLSHGEIQIIGMEQLLV